MIRNGSISNCVILNFTPNSNNSKFSLVGLFSKNVEVVDYALKFHSQYQPQDIAISTVICILTILYSLWNLHVLFVNQNTCMLYSYLAESFVFITFGKNWYIFSWDFLSRVISVLFCIIFCLTSDTLIIFVLHYFTYLVMFCSDKFSEKENVSECLMVQVP